MELPPEILRLIKEYSLPLTKPDWRKGCYYNRQIERFNFERHPDYIYGFRRVVNIIAKMRRERYVMDIILFRAYNNCIYLVGI